MSDNVTNRSLLDHASLSTESPWPGLETYREADHKFFHGRRGETQELLRLTMRAPLTILFGLSGLGKSSLVQAGLFPYLRLQDVLPIYIRLNFGTEPTNLIWQTKQTIMAEAAQASIEAPVATEEETLWEYFHRQDADFWSGRNRLMQPLLVIDQFEEIFTIGKATRSRAKASEAFLTELSDLVESRPPSALKDHLETQPENGALYSFRRHHYKVLIILREDFLADLETLKGRMRSISYNRMRLSRLNGAAAMEVVANAQHLIDAQVAEEVVRFVAATDDVHEPLEKLQVEPALLSVVCRELNTKRQQRNESYITADLLEGSQEEILSGFYERSIADCSQEARAFVEEKLLTVSGYRDSIAVENALSIPGLTPEIIGQLIDRRLVRKDEHGEMPRLELTHDLLTGVISISRDRRRLLEAEELSQKELAENERQKRLEEQAKSAKRLMWLSGALTVFAVVAGLASFVALKQRQIAERAMIEAVQAQNVADETSQRIKDNIKLRRAALSRDWATVDSFKDQKLDKRIKFVAIAKEYPYKSLGGLQTYRFEMRPDEESIPGITHKIALITYIMENSTFLNPLITAGPANQFTGTYDGVGCLYKVRAVIEYVDSKASLAIAEFNMCDIIEWRHLKGPKNQK